MIQPESALYLFPVPLSADTRPADVLPPHNIELLGGIKHFAVENLRSARRFLKAANPSIDIDALSLIELSEHTPAEQVEGILKPLTDGHAMGIISEAGCPAVADPGSDLVAAAQRRGYNVIPLVGPSSILMSLMASGFNGQNFTFRGYLPIDTAARSKAIRDMEAQARRRCTQIFIETPYRNNRLIAQLSQTLQASTLLCVASNITSPEQSIITATAANWRKRVYDYSKIPTIFLIG